MKVSQADDELSLTLAPTNPEEMDVIVKLALDKAAMDIAPIETTGKPRLGDPDFNGSPSL